MSEELQKRIISLQKEAAEELQKHIIRLQEATAEELQKLNSKDAICEKCIGYCFGNSVCHKLLSEYCGKTVHHLFSCSQWEEWKK